MADNSHIAVPLKGMNTDLHDQNLDEQSYDFALNADLEDADGQGMVFQNLPSSLKAVDFPAPVNGFLRVIEQNRVLFFLAGETSIIGEITGFNNPLLPADTHTLTEEDCAECGQYNAINQTNTLKPTLQFREIVRSRDLNFSIHAPISAVYRSNDCGIEIVFNDNRNDRRRLELEFTDPLDITSPLRVKDEFFKILRYEHPDPDCGISGEVHSLEPVYSTDLDVNRMSFHPTLERILLDIIDEVPGGGLKAGVYQFMACWADEKGTPLTSYYPATNPAHIFSRQTTVDTDYVTGKALIVGVETDMRSVYRYFNLAVAETINSSTGFKLVGTYSVGTTRVTYTGTDTYITLSASEVFDRMPYFKRAAEVATSNDYLFFAAPTEWPKGNWQRVANKVRLYWQTAEMPMGNYRKSFIASKYRSLLRDEIYPFGIEFEFTNGDKTPAFHIPGRLPFSQDTLAVPTSGIKKDVWDQRNCDDPDGNATVPYWKVYNTASVKGIPRRPYNADNPCELFEYEWGEMSYWESAEHYPHDIDIWGELAGKPIRHHKMPDFTISPFYKSTVNGDSVMIYPLGVKVDHASVIAALNEAVTCGFITAEDRGRIKGYRIVRGNRAGQNSIVAKGLLYDVWNYKKQNKTFFYPNYPFNDLRPDPYISPTIDTYSMGYGAAAHNVTDTFKMKFEGTGRYTFHSPETHFNDPNIEGVDEVKFECVQIGTCEGSFAEIQNHAKYKLVGLASYIGSLLLSVPTSDNCTFNGVALSAVACGPVKMITDLFDNLETVPAGQETTFAQTARDNAQLINNFLNQYELWKSVSDALAPFTNFFYQFQGVGKYTNAIPIRTNNIRRRVSNRAYLPSRVSVFEEAGRPLYFNNWHRESSVYLKTDDPVEHASTYFEDNSRYLLSQFGDCNKPENKRFTNISAFYAAIKRPLAAQYGSIYSVEYVDTGSFQDIAATRDLMVFGGDTFIGNFGIKRKHPFFLYSGVNMTAGSDLIQSEIGNVGYPNYYWDSSRGFLEKIEDFTTSGFTTFLNTFNDGDKLRKLFGLPVYRFDCREDKKLYIKGKVYSYSYGISYFPVETAVNIDLRHGTDSAAGDFYPNNQDLDTWLQEKNVPIKEDNQFHYNRTYSKQNKETVLVGMPVDYEPSELCKTVNPNDVIYSKDWRSFRSADNHRFSFKNGRLVSITGIENDKVLARFEKTFEIFNAYITLPTSADAAIVSTGKMFEQKPQQFTQTELGYAGTQHRAFLSTEFGHVWVNAQNGQIYVLGNNGAGFEEISRQGMNKWFKEHLPFRILRHFPGLLDSDNNFYGIGIALGFEKQTDKLFVTKLDYEVINKDLRYDNSTREFYFIRRDGNRQTVELGDPRHFRNVSWTASYKFTDKAWRSFHSFTPNYYVSLPTYLQGGDNEDCPTLWNEHMHNSSFQIYHGQVSPFAIQVITKPALKDQVMRSIRFASEVVRYHGEDEFYFDLKTFNKALVYNRRQCSGMLYLKPGNQEDLYHSGLFPRPMMDGSEILVSKNAGAWSFNQFYDIALARANNIPIMNTTPDGTHRVPNPDAIDPFMDETYRQRFRSDVHRVRLINDAETDFKFRLKWIFNNQIDDK